MTYTSKQTQQRWRSQHFGERDIMRAVRLARMRDAMRQWRALNIYREGRRSWGPPSPKKRRMQDYYKKR